VNGIDKDRQCDPRGPQFNYEARTAAALFLTGPKVKINQDQVELAFFKGKVSCLVSVYQVNVKSKCP
jgi:hypothetical protein